MQINKNNVNDMNNNFKGINMNVEKIPELNEIMRAFRTSVMSCSFECEKNTQALVKKTKGGEYSFELNTYKDIDTNNYISNLSINYSPNRKEFIIGKDLVSGSKQDILDFLGNEKNTDNIEFLMAVLKKEADKK